MPYIKLSHDELCTVRLAVEYRQATLETRCRGNREYISTHYEGHPLSEREKERVDMLHQAIAWDEEEIARCVSALEHLENWKEDDTHDWPRTPGYGLQPPMLPQAHRASPAGGAAPGPVGSSATAGLGEIKSAAARGPNL